jgi:mannose-6-phosphate isomerase-like protein (cupin superfamily)
MNAHLGSGGTIATLAGAETILRRERREIGILVAREEVTITHARYAAGERVAGPHIHHAHTDAFYVLEGELTFEVGPDAEPVTVSAGGFVAVPPRVAHSFRNGGDHPARWLTIHAQDGGFATFMRGVRDGVEVEWDIAPVPAGGGLPASEAVIDFDADGELLQLENRLRRLRCSLPDLRVVEWHLHGPQHDLPFRRPSGRVDSFFVIEGELEATLAGTTRTVGPDTLIAVPRGVRCTLHHHGPGRARLLVLHTPDGDAADHRDAA